MKRLLRWLGEQLDKKIDRHPCPVCDRMVRHGHMEPGLDACDACEGLQSRGIRCGHILEGKKGDK